ncbi:MAG: hypothetical protein JWR26_4161 [Pedosphaera sp.]|nr:hypothetical protein [Pedosphaera sp.]
MGTGFCRMPAVARSESRMRDVALCKSVQSRFAKRRLGYRFWRRPVCEGRSFSPASARGTWGMRDRATVVPSPACGGLPSSGFAHGSLRTATGEDLLSFEGNGVVSWSWAHGGDGAVDKVDLVDHMDEGQDKRGRLLGGTGWKERPVASFSGRLRLAEAASGRMRPHEAGYFKCVFPGGYGGHKRARAAGQLQEGQCPRLTPIVPHCPGVFLCSFFRVLAHGLTRTSTDRQPGRRVDAFSKVLRSKRQTFPQVNPYIFVMLGKGCCHGGVGWWGIETVKNFKR